MEELGIELSILCLCCGSEYDLNKILKTTNKQKYYFDLNTKCSCGNTKNFKLVSFEQKEIIFK